MKMIDEEATELVRKWNPTSHTQESSEIIDKSYIYIFMVQKAFSPEGENT